MKKEQKYEYASFWRRFGALIIDLAIINILLRILLPTKNKKPPLIHEKLNWLFNLSISLPGIIDLISECGYFVYFWANDRQTIGQHVFGIKTIRKDGEILSYTDSLIRFIGFIISSSVLGFGLLWMLIDKDKQGLHDKMASTIVIKSKLSATETAEE